MSTDEPYVPWKVTMYLAKWQPAKAEKSRREYRNYDSNVRRRKRWRELARRRARG